MYLWKVTKFKYRRKSFGLKIYQGSKNSDRKTKEPHELSIQIDL